MKKSTANVLLLSFILVLTTNINLEEYTLNTVFKGILFLFLLVVFYIFSMDLDEPTDKPDLF